MPLLTFDSLDEVEETRRDTAVELKDGRYALVEDTDVTPLKAKADELLKETKAERAKRKELEARLAAYEQERTAREAGLTKDKLDEIMAQAEAKYRPVVDELEKARTALRSERLDGRVKALLGQARAADIDATFKVVGDHFDLTDDGALVVKADPTVKVEDYIGKTLTTRYPFLFQGTMASGSGAQGIKGAVTNGLNARPITQWSSDERAAFIESNGIEAFQSKLRDEQMAAFAKGLK